MNYAIQTENLTKAYGKNRGITDLNLSVEQGDFFGFIGPNGAGKSTTIRTLLGLISPTSGNAKVLSFDIRKDKEKILSHTGYLPSEIHFHAKMKVRDVLRFSSELRHVRCDERTEKLCKRLDLDPSRKVDELSLGNRKKVGIICAVQHQPDLLILDEPTSGLDPLMQKEFFTILSEEHDRGATIFFSSHILNEVQTYCRRAAFIKDGRLILSDDVEKLEQTGTKKVLLRGKINSEKIFSLPGVSAPDKERMSFLYKGDLTALLKTLAEEKPEDVTITEPSLEEIFLNYYE